MIGIRRNSPRRFLMLACGAGIAASLLAPTAATALPAEGASVSFFITNAALADEQQTASLSVVYQCAIGNELNITVKLFQDASRHGEATQAATCTGKAHLLKVAVPSADAPWQYGRSVAFVRAFGDSINQEQTTTVTMKAPFLP